VLGTIVATLALLIATPEQSAKPAEVGQQHQPPKQNADKSGGVVTPNEVLTPKRQRNPGREKKDGDADPDRWTHGDTIQTITAAATALYFGATVWILMQMRRANKHADDTHEESKADTAASLRLTADGLAETRRAVEVAATQAKAMAETVQIARLDQRAWVGVMKVTGRPAIGDRLDVGVDIQNTGRTPALSARSKMRVRLLSEYVGPALSDAQWVPFALRSRGVLAPGALSHLANCARTGVEPMVLTARDVAEIASGKLSVFVDGRIDYKDVFGAEHWVCFCYVWNRTDDCYTQYESGNETDEFLGATQAGIED
jgi:hypothetical protein